MKSVDLLSDTTYRREAVEQLERLLGNGNARFPVKATQIYGLRQIARQQPDSVQEFARKQRIRAEKKQGTDAEIAFWTLVDNLCSLSTSGWAVPKEAGSYLPVELRDENIPSKRSGMTQADQRRRNRLRAQQRAWIARWTAEHIPAFFERFCTHALYRIGMAANSEEE